MKNKKETLEERVKRIHKKILSEVNVSVQLTDDEAFGVLKILDYISNKMSGPQLTKIAQTLDLDSIDVVRSKFKTKVMYGSSKREKEVWQ